MTIHGAPQDPAIAGVEGGVKGKGAVAVILKAMAFGSPRGKRQHRIKPVKRLNGRLFIDAKDGGVLRWVEVKPDDVGSLLLKMGIVAGQVAFQPMGGQTSPLPNPRHHHVTDAEFCRQLAGAPVGRTIAGLLPGLGQYPGFQLGRALVWSPSLMAAVKSRPTLRHKPLRPESDEPSATAQLGSDRLPGETIGQQHDQPRPPGQISASLAPLDQLLQRQTLRATKSNLHPASTPINRCLFNRYRPLGRHNFAITREAGN